MMKKTNTAGLLLICLSLAACKASEQAFYSPRASYLNGEKVKTIPPEKRVTFVGSTFDESGNLMPAYPSNSGRAHKIIHFSPPPASVGVACEKSDVRLMHSRVSVETTQSGYDVLRGPFQEGKTYQVYCNLQANGYYKVSKREVPEGTSFKNSRARKPSQAQKPNDDNRVRFIITGKSSLNPWRWAGDEYMSIQGWNGKFGENVEHAAPLKSIVVQCQANRQIINVTLNHNFLPGKTYQLACRKTPEGRFEAYVNGVK